MRPLLIFFAAVLILLVGVFPFVDDGTQFIGDLPTSLAIVVGSQLLLIVMHIAMARRVRDKTLAASRALEIDEVAR